MTAVSTATAGLQNASRTFEASAAQLANAGSGSDDLVAAVTETLSAQNTFSINVAVLRNALDMQRRVLDILV